MEVDEVRETSERGVEIEIERVYYVAKKRVCNGRTDFMVVSIICRHC